MPLILIHQGMARAQELWYPIFLTVLTRTYESVLGTTRRTNTKERLLSKSNMADEFVERTSNRRAKMTSK